MTATPIAFDRTDEPALRLAAFLTAAGRADGQLEAAFEALCALAGATIGARLFTITTQDPVTAGSARIYSNRPDVYPVHGTKPADTTDWSRQVLDEKRTFVANDIDSIRDVFPDHELIGSIGCGSVINVPLVLGGRVAGTLNCLDAAGHYTPDRVAASEILKLPGLVCLLLNEARGPAIAGG